MEKVKLSQLPDDTKISIEDSSRVYTAAEVKREIIEFGEPHHESSWYIVVEKRWRPDAKYMVQMYIEREYDDMYEDWDERAFECITEDHIRRIQVVLDEAFAGDYATKYWEYGEPVEIDIFPSEGEESA